jgi:hypothetical protein
MPAAQPPVHRPFLDPEGGGERERKTVSTKAYARLAVAADAIAATKKMIPYQGNQVPALAATNMNSKYRLQVMRDYFAWEYTTPEAREAASENPEADVAAKAELAHGGNCGEHAWVAYWYLRKHASGERIQRSQKDGFDHAFVIVGDLADKDSELAVSDPWPNSPTACLWEDHFAWCERDQLLAHQSMTADGQCFKEVIMAGLKLSAYGEEMLKRSESEEETQDKVDHWEEHHFWAHDDTGGEQYDYQPKRQRRRRLPVNGSDLSPPVPEASLHP